MSEQYSKGYNTGYAAGYKSGVKDALSGAVGAAEHTQNLPIKGLCLSTRAYNALHQVGYQRIGELVKLSAEEIWRIRRLGCKSADEVARELHRYNIYGTAWDDFILKNADR